MKKLYEVRQVTRIDFTIQVAIQVYFDNKRMIQVFPTGEENDQCCVHGIKLRWSCDECEEFFDHESMEYL